ncbi:MAG TPA: c-type cytochrome domain-containing protein [Phycisphaerales bacterium]|nr:c-type cytochrome domain-containing protein [Phycisphaerales bacterium]
MIRPPSARSLVLGGCIVACAVAPAAAGAVGPAADLPRFLGRLHPMVVHFPIALLGAAVLFEIGTIILRRSTVKPSGAAVACVVVGTLGAAAAAWFGWINADLEPHGRGVADLVEVHRWLGITTVALAGVALVAAAIAATGKARVMTAIYRVALVLAAGVVAVAGHWGGSIVYGEDYLVEVLFPRPASAPSEGAAPAAPPDSGAHAVDFASQIAPIFAEHCIDCHGPDKGKGNLRLHAREYVFDRRDADEQVIVPGDAFASELYFRISLPPDDEDAMPPEGKAEPLTPGEVALIAAWIDEGAVWSEGPATVPADPGLAQEPDQGAEFVFDAAAAAEQAAALARLRERGAVATRLSAADPWIEVRFDLLGAAVTDGDLALLRGLEPTLVSLNLSGTSVTDEGLAGVGAFARLERLHLGRTAVTDAGIAHLAGLQALTYLNLYGTGVTDQALVRIADLPRLRNLYVWDTAVSSQAGALLAALRPGLAVEASGELKPATFAEGEELAPAPELAGAPGAAAQVGAGTTVIDAALLPACCRAAVEKGGECDHPCCVEARLAGATCKTCGQ